MVARPVAGERPKVLFLCQNLPFPPDSGVHIRSYHTLKILASAFDVRALCFYRRAALQRPGAVEDAVQALSREVPIEAFPIPQEYSTTRFVWDHVRSVVRRRVFTYFAHDARRFRDSLEEALRSERFDLVHLDSLDLSRWLDVLPSDVTIVCTHHNVESDLLTRRAQSERHPLVRAYLKLQAGLALEEERRSATRVDLHIAVSERDAELLRSIIPDCKVVVAPNGVDTEYFKPSSGAGAGIVFVGGYGWLPNRDGMIHFLTDILPRVRASLPDVPVTWIGVVPEAVKKRLSSEYGVSITGYVDDIRPYLAASRCYVVPLRIGGGTRLKILDAWAMGCAIVSTSQGCEGLEARDGVNMVIRDDPTAFADAVLAVLTDDDLASTLRLAGRRTALSVYDWTNIQAVLLNAYRALLETPPNRSNPTPA